jgi:prephenate dehydrogenase
MQTVAIVGVGLIGGSFGLALRQAGFTGEIWGVSSPSTIDSAVARGAIDRGVELEEAAAANLVYLAQPIQQILQTIGALERLVRPGTLVTDAGSTKRKIVEAARETMPEGCFLGGHPMAGKETRGVESAEADLFAGRPYVLTPLEMADLEAGAAKAFRGWIEKIGARIVVMPAEEHDRAVGLASHLPQLLSSALALTSCEYPEIAGPGVTDMTRLALSPYSVWRDILATNRDNIDQSLAAMIGRLEQFRAALSTRGLEDEFEAAARHALRLRQP